ncbi:hypothetical protein RD792_013037 [Penstemon davidsonii]|uniref:IPO4/5-like TPR repeats domain-containing protein n=1 Tax=Penstemon davidsonii TaxID=160366 RepID=A0ABR0CTU6_9LAMI|nr:hypothetical protein RD792_013037 [Penstemon davidsonii]
MNLTKEVTQVLLSAQSVDSPVRKHAEDSLKQLHDQTLHTSSYHFLKYLLEKHLKDELVQRWFSFDVAVKSQIKLYMLQTLFSAASEARSAASQVIAKVAGIELPQKQWPELIGFLLSNIHMVTPHAKQACLETFGYLYEEVVPNVIDDDQVNKMLEAVVQCMNSNEVTEVQLSAIRALNNVLGFAQANFSNDVDRSLL